MQEQLCWDRVNQKSDWFDIPHLCQVLNSKQESWLNFVIRNYKKKKAMKYFITKYIILKKQTKSINVHL